MGYGESKTMMAGKKKNQTTFRKVSFLLVVWFFPPTELNLQRVRWFTKGFFSYAALIYSPPPTRTQITHDFFFTIWPLVVQYSNILCKAGGSFFLTQEHKALLGDTNLNEVQRFSVIYGFAFYHEPWLFYFPAIFFFRAWQIFETQWPFSFSAKTNYRTWRSTYIIHHRRLQLPRHNFLQVF